MQTNCQSQEHLILAVPVAPPDTLQHIKQEVNQVICLSAPPSFQAVGQYYSHFDPTSDEEVIALLTKQYGVHP